MSAAKKRPPSKAAFRRKGAFQGGKAFPYRIALRARRQCPPSPPPPRSSPRRRASRPASPARARPSPAPPGRAACSSFAPPPSRRRVRAPNVFSTLFAASGAARRLWRASTPVRRDYERVDDASAAASPRSPRRFRSLRPPRRPRRRHLFHPGHHDELTTRHVFQIPLPTGPQPLRAVAEPAGATRSSPFTDVGVEELDPEVRPSDDPSPARLRPSPPPRRFEKPPPPPRRRKPPPVALRFLPSRP